MHRIARTLIASLLLLASRVSTNAGEQRDADVRSTVISLGDTSAAARTIRPPRDGDRVRVIVEFDLPPLVRAGSTARVIAMHSDLLARFRGDLARIDAGSARERSSPSTIEHEYSRVYSGAAVSTDDASLGALERLDYVRRVTPDTEVRASVEPGVAIVGADQVWSSYATRGAGITVAVIDSGIDYTHPALGGGFGPSFKVAGGWDFVNNDADPMDDDGHGTHVAGIVAASSADLLGVAPDATLLAYKVLNANGVGYPSAIIAAIEKSVDPNGDFDYSDHAHIANLSLGGEGSPDDPQSQAVDNAVSVGVVVCVAAGNNGSWQSVGSPGTAASAITVGAIDEQGALATFSSRGPVPTAYTLKPDVVAPGVNVRSARLGGGTLSLDGTSMAAPHVAGVAALLRAIHPEWTADQVKSAITSTAEPVDASVMAAGAGRVDTPRAASIGTSLTPTSLDFGRVEASSPLWSSRRGLTVRNLSSETRTYTIGVEGQKPGLTLTSSIGSFSLPPGAERGVELSARVDNALLPFPDDGSLTHGGFVIVDDGSHRARVAWAVIKGARVRVEYAGDEFLFGFIGRAETRSEYLRSSGARTFENLVSPGTYDVTLFAMPADSRPNAVIAFERVAVAGDRGLVASYESATHHLTFTAFDENGRRFGTAPGPLSGCGQERVVRGPGDPAPYASFGLGVSPDLRTTTLSARYTVAGVELCADETPTRFYNIQYEPIRGVSSDLERSAGGSALVGQNIDLRFAPPHDGERELSVINTLHEEGIPFILSRAVLFPWSEARWSGTLFIHPPADPEIEYLARVRALSYDESHAGVVVSRHLHLLDDGVLGFDGVTPAPTSYLARPGEPLVFGAGGVAPWLVFVGAENVLVQLNLFGNLEELRYAADTRMRLFADDGTLVEEGTTQVAIPDTTARRRLEIDATTHEINGQPGTTRVTTMLGGQEDWTPPTLTSLTLLDEGGARVVDRARRGRAPRLRFSAIDLAEEPANVIVGYRRSGTQAWSTIPVVKTGADYGGDELGHTPRGTIYEAPLRDVTTNEGLYDLRIELSDRAGNATTTVISPAIAIVDGRPRPIRR